MFLYLEQEVQTKSNPEPWSIEAFLEAFKGVTDHKKDSMAASSENSDSEEDYEEVLMTK